MRASSWRQTILATLGYFWLAAQAGSIAREGFEVVLSGTDRMVGLLCIVSGLTAAIGGFIGLRRSFTDILTALWPADW